MKVLRTAVLLLGTCLLSGAALAQGTLASVIDLTSNTVASPFTIGTNPTAVAWASNTVAYVVNDEGNTLVRLDMTTSPPTITATYTFADPAFGPHALAINPAGTRALVTGDTTQALLLNLTTTPFTVADTISVVLDGAGVAFYSAGTKGIVVNESNVLFLDLTVVPAVVTTVSLGSNLGLAVAVNPLGTRAAITIDTGGLQVIDLTTSPPSLIGGLVGPTTPSPDPLGVAISPDGTRAIYVDESIPAPEANVINITGSPALINTLPIGLSSPSAVAFNPVSAAALIAGDDGVAILNPPYTSVSTTILHPGRSGATTFSIAVNPAGTRAIVLHEDAPVGLPTPTVPAPAATPTPTPTGIPAPSVIVPTLSPWMLGLLGVLIAAIGYLASRRSS